MGTVENSTVRFGFRFCFYGSVLSRFPKRFINDISWIRNYAMECVAELAWTCKFLYTSSLASFSMLRRLLRIVKWPENRKRHSSWLWNGYLICALDRHCEASRRYWCWQFYYASSVHRKPNRMEWAPVSDRVTAMLRPISHVDRSPVPIPSC